MECQHHTNCGDFCLTERERSFVLCENCLDAADHDEIHVFNDKNTIIGLQLQINGLKTALQGLLNATVNDCASEVKENALNHAKQALSIVEASAAVLLNGHASKTESYSNMRPGTSTSLPD